jgi:peptidoglycan/LPS O-acetylase OafA/YrhL
VSRWPEATAPRPAVRPRRLWLIVQRPVYGYPIQQTLVWAGVGSSIAMLCLSLPLSLAFGYASWHLVESRFVRRSGRRTAPVTRT